jgi:hypothetical protein
MSGFFSFLMPAPPEDAEPSMTETGVAPEPGETQHNIPTPATALNQSAPAAAAQVQPQVQPQGITVGTWRATVDILLSIHCPDSLPFARSGRLWNRRHEHGYGCG